MYYTVKELVEELQGYDEDNIVWIEMDRMQAPVRIVKLDEDEENRLVLK